jgi:hypothetical protein
VERLAASGVVCHNFVLIFHHPTTHGGPGCHQQERVQGPPNTFIVVIIVNKVRGVNRVVHDISRKPPATIEGE